MGVHKRGFNMFKEFPASKGSIARRRPVCGIGTNDANYNTFYVTESGRKTCPYYNRWNGMLERCYGDHDASRRRCYKGCTVSKEWLLFSNFRAWMKNQDWEGLELDKDIILPGNKEYSKEYCVFVPQWINKLLTNVGNKNSGWLIGASWVKQTGRYGAQIKVNNKNKWLGTFDSKEQAQKAYVYEKIKIITKIASDVSNKAVSKGLMLHAGLLKLQIRGIENAKRTTG